MKNLKNYLSFLVIVMMGFLIYSCPAAPTGNSSGGGNSSSPSSAAGPSLAPGVYISTNGSDGGAGTNYNAPVKTFQTALAKAAAYSLTNIYVSRGVYSNGNGLNPVTNSSGVTNSGVLITNNNINMIGGFSPDFSTRNGMSEMDGSMLLYHIIYVSNASHVRIDGFVIRNGNAAGINPDDWGGGVYFQNVSWGLITNCVISNNTAALGAAGVVIFLGSYNTVNSLICFNSATDYGGGLRLHSSDHNTIGGSIYGNTSQWGGGVLMSSSGYNLINAAIYSNTASTYGGGIDDGGYYNTINGNIINNTSSGNGGGISCNGSFCTISANVSGNNGGGIYIIGAWNVTVTGSTLTDNGGPGNVVNLYNFQNKISNLIISNCLIGGRYSDNSYGIYELSVDLSNHVIVDNTFVTNQLLYIYHDVLSNNMSLSGWGLINDTNFTGAKTASGNKITNL